MGRCCEIDAILARMRDGHGCEGVTLLRDRTGDDGLPGHERSIAQGVGSFERAPATAQLQPVALESRRAVGRQVRLRDRLSTDRASTVWRAITCGMAAQMSPVRAKAVAGSCRCPDGEPTALDGGEVSGLTARPLRGSAQLPVTTTVDPDLETAGGGRGRGDGDGRAEDGLAARLTREHPRRAGRLDSGWRNR